MSAAKCRRFLRVEFSTMNGGTEQIYYFQSDWLFFKQVTHKGGWGCSSPTYCSGLLSPAFLDAFTVFAASAMAGCSESLSKSTLTTESFRLRFGVRKLNFTYSIAEVPDADSFGELLLMAADLSCLSTRLRAWHSFTFPLSAPASKDLGLVGVRGNRGAAFPRPQREKSIS